MWTDYFYAVQDADSFIEPNDAEPEEGAFYVTEFDQSLWSDAAGRHYNTATDASDSLLVRERSYQDNATPAENGVVIANLMLLSLLIQELNYLDCAEEALKAFSVVMEQATRACPTLFQSLGWYCHQTLVSTGGIVLLSYCIAIYPQGFFLLILNSQKILLV